MYATTFGDWYTAQSRRPRPAPGARSTRSAAPPRPASEKQLTFLNSLIASKVIDPGIRTGIDATLATEGGPTTRQASQLIDYLLKQPSIPREDAVTEAGFYLLDDGEDGPRLFKVQWNRAATSLYAKERVAGRWEYAPGVMRKLSADNKLTEELAKELAGLS